VTACCELRPLVRVEIKSSLILLSCTRLLAWRRHERRISHARPSATISSTRTRPGVHLQANRVGQRTTASGHAGLGRSRPRRSPLSNTRPLCKGIFRVPLKRLSHWLLSRVRRYLHRRAPRTPDLMHRVAAGEQIRAARGTSSKQYRRIAPGRRGLRSARACRRLLIWLLDHGEVLVSLPTLTG
jgi:antitoxin (DNA-binding transcriptional repressor) of toxin-antitoxin stability system